MSPDLIEALRQLANAPADATSTPKRKKSPQPTIRGLPSGTPMPADLEEEGPLGKAMRYGRTALDFTPVIGDALSAGDAGQELRRGNLGSAALSALAATPLLGVVADVVKGSKRADKGAQALSDLAGITVYHGTPNKFLPEPGAPLGRFRLDKMGSGEGAQSYGWGNYFGEAMKVGEKYKNLDRPKLSKWTYDGVPVEERFRQFTPEHRAVTMLWGAGGDTQKAANKQREYIAQLEGYEAQYPGQRIYAERVEKEKEALDRLLALSGEKLQPPQGTLYEVRLDVDPSSLLDWDRPLKEQPGEILRALRQINPSIKGSMIGGEGYLRADNYLANFGNEDRRWEDLIADLQDRLDVDLSTTATPGQVDAEDVDRWIKTLSERRGEVSPAELTKVRAVFDDPSKAVSLHLNDANIPGLRYLDEYSRPGARNAATPTRNYVIWNEERIKILRTLAALGMAGAAEELARLEGASSTGSQEPPSF